jgi:hypothetical protein
MEPGDRNRMRPPDRVILTQVPSRRQWLTQTLWWIVIVAGLFLVIWANDTDRMWISAAGLAVVLGGLFASVRDWSRLRAEQPALDDARFDEWAADRPQEFVMRRRLAFGWPLAFSLASIPFVAVALRSGAAPAPLSVAALLVAASVVSWLLALRLQAPFLRLNADGLMLNGQLVHWRRVADLRADFRIPMFNRRSREVGYMLVIFFEPLSDDDFPRGALGRFVRGDNHRELVISLARTQETPAVVYQIAQDFWQQARQRSHGVAPKLLNRS